LGGCLSPRHWLVGQTHQFRAAVAQNAVTDLNVMWHLSDLQSWTEHDMSGLPWDVPERLRRHSPLTHASKVKTPTLILHATNDRRCLVAMGRMFDRAPWIRRPIGRRSIGGQYAK
jgi:dipeptidyl aminopeptidase/acylaminoacyl peptidase